MAIVRCLIGSLAVLDCPSASGFDRGEALVVFLVLDENAGPVEGVQVYCAAWRPETARRSARHKRTFQGKTDRDGSVRVSIIAYHDMTCRFVKSGYYESSLRYVFTNKANPALVDGRWQPWETTETMVIKRIIDPIPMYVGMVDEPIPVLGTPIGYDLYAGDWVPPHGAGNVSDFVFTATGEYRGLWDRDLHLTLTFSRANDGIISYEVPVDGQTPVGSRLVSSHQAPLAGYEPKYELTSHFARTRAERRNTEPRPGRGFYCRVRTEVGDDGRVKKGLYGKIKGDLHAVLHNPKEIRLKFMYFLNPYGTRNVEHDWPQRLTPGSRHPVRPPGAASRGHH